MRAIARLLIGVFLFSPALTTTVLAQATPAAETPPESCLVAFTFPVVPGEHPVLQAVEDQLRRYFDGKLDRFDLPLDLKGSEFERTVWQALLRIPCGETRSYAQIATEVGHTGSARAVGRANGANPVAVIVPCHRVVRADGSLCGYGGGVWRKQRLLELERASAPSGAGKLFW